MPSPSNIDARARLEDVRWFVETGENAEGAAARLGIKVDALEKWCSRHARDEWVVLLARNPHDPNAQSRGRNQWTGAA